MLKLVRETVLRSYYLWVAMAALTVAIAFPLLLIYQVLCKCAKALLLAWGETRCEMRVHWSRDSFERIKQRYGY